VCGGVGAGVESCGKIVVTASSSQVCVSWWVVTEDVAVLEIRVLGGLEVIRDGVTAPLPPSRKTRALLAYLALTRRPHRREQLCEMFWDVPDDPRGALRWSLSKIRPLVDELEFPRLIADRQTVELLTEALDIDFFSARVCAGDKAAVTGDLARAASSFRGPLLADLDLPANSEFHSWLLGPREDARKLQAQILRNLIERLDATARAALPYARELVRVDPYDETAWALLIGTLANAGRSGEIRQQYEAGLHSLREVGGGSGATAARLGDGASIGRPLPRARHGPSGAPTDTAAVDCRAALCQPQQ
jgi:DNA-binding SARP family transcriptional activator